ncbi:MAG: ABC transporter substrate-binding protein [Devosia sp.]
MTRRLLTILAFILAVAPPAMAQSFPVTIEHALGTTTIPAEPQRVVALGYVDHDYLYALGVAPVAVREWWGEHPYATWPWAEEARAAIGAEPEVFPAEEINLELVLAADPDLILVVYEDIDQALYDKLSQIAPTVANVKDFPLWGAPWQENLRIMDRATTGTTVKAEAIIADIDAQVAAARAAYPILEGKTGTNAYYSPERGFTLWGPTDTASRLLLSFGLVYPAGIEQLQDKDARIVISAENMRLLDADVIVWPIEDPAANVENQVKALPLYSNIRLGQEERSVWLDDGHGVLSGALSFQSPLSIPYLIKVLPPMMAAAVDGDPATVPVVPAD